jgi:hypothetical protein
MLLGYILEYSLIVETLAQCEAFKALLLSTIVYFYPELDIICKCALIRVIIRSLILMSRVCLEKKVQNIMQQKN